MDSRSAWSARRCCRLSAEEVGSVLAVWPLELSLVADLARACGPISDGGNGSDVMSAAVVRPMKRDMSVAGGVGVRWDELPGSDSTTHTMKACASVVHLPLHTKL